LKDQVRTLRRLNSEQGNQIAALTANFATATKPSGVEAVAQVKPSVMTDLTNLTSAAVPVKQTPKEHQLDQSFKQSARTLLRKIRGESLNSGIKGAPEIQTQLY